MGIPGYDGHRVFLLSLLLAWERIRCRRGIKYRVRPSAILCIRSSKTTGSSSAVHCSPAAGSRPSCRPPPRSTGTTCLVHRAPPVRSGSTCSDTAGCRWGRRHRRSRTRRTFVLPRIFRGSRIRHRTCWTRTGWAAVGAWAAPPRVDGGSVVPAPPS